MHAILPSCLTSVASDVQAGDFFMSPWNSAERWLFYQMYNYVEETIDRNRIACIEDDEKWQVARPGPVDTDSERRRQVRQRLRIQLKVLFWLCSVPPNPKTKNPVKALE